ncbi:unnamed protein product [Anisakis simplex]|uniref:3-hydroxy-3-methylglutaryl coenzyme A reductase n=1 Tax=Anisakis simplex TaxID=6269 RepID=A0A0M3K0D6_ANISI|nr:unnamed protein product [Anisakis simplex]
MNKDCLGPNVERRRILSGELRQSLSNIVNAVVLDDTGEWKLNLVEQIFQLLQPSFDSVINHSVPATATVKSEEHNSGKPKFELGPSDSSSDLTFCKPMGSSSHFEQGVSSDVGVQVDLANLGSLPVYDPSNDKPDAVTLNTLITRLKTTGIAWQDFANMKDKEIVELLNMGYMKQRELESKLGSDLVRAVSLRRMHISSSSNIALNELPFKQFDYSVVSGACCENVIGYVPIPTGVAGPLVVNGRRYLIPLATTEGALVASTNRGCRAITESGGVTARVYKDAMTRAPVVQLENAIKALELKEWLEDASNFAELKKVFDATSNYARLQRLDADPNGRLLYIRFEAKTGDAMGMNMVSKGVSAVMTNIKQRFPSVKLISLSGNYCVDKKACALNWIKGRGKSLVSEAVIPSAVVRNILKTDVDSMCRLAESKLLIGSSMAGTIGGWNAHAANIVAAIFIATGQDAAQVVSSSMCMTTFEKTSLGDLYISCNMRCLEVGTVGGGTILPAQKACLKMLGCAGANRQSAGDNSKRLAEIICGAVMAGELSLMAAQCSDDLIKSHLKLNRSSRVLQKVDISPKSLVPPVRQRCCSDEAEAAIKLPSPEKTFEVSVRDKSNPKKKVQIEATCSNLL